MDMVWGGPNLWRKIMKFNLKLAFVSAVALLLAACAGDPPPAPVETVDQGGAPAAVSTPLVSAEDLELQKWGGASQPGLSIFAGSDRVFFAYDSSELTDMGRNLLNKQADWLMHYGNVKATVEGHCDERGTRDYNLALGERRAVAVKNHLVARGVSSYRLKTVSYGKERPAVVGSMESSYKQNRRGVLVLD